MLDRSVSFSFSFSEMVMVNRASWYKQLKSIIPTNIPNQKARPKKIKISINYKSQSKKSTFFTSFYKNGQVPEKRLCIFPFSPKKTRHVPEKKIALFFVFFSKKWTSPRKNSPNSGAVNSLFSILPLFLSCSSSSSSSSSSFSRLKPQKPGEN